MNKRVKAFFSMGMVSVFQIMLNIVRNKITAVILGTYGIGILSVINNILGIGQTISSLGINNGIVKEVSNDTNNKQKIGYVVSTSYITAVVSSSILVIIMLILSKQISFQNLDSQKYYKYIIIIALSIPITTFNGLDISIINGFKEINVIAKVSIITSVVNIIVSVFLIYFFKLNGAIYSIVIMAIIGYIINLYALKDVFNKNKIKFKITFDNYKLSVFKILIAFGSANIFALLFSNISLLMIRTAITRKLGMNYNGIFQVDWSIINQYVGILFSSCSVYYFPTLCSLKTNEERVEEMNRTLELLLLLIVPLFIGILCFKSVIITLLYSSEFKLSAELLSVFIIGVYFKVIAWTIGFVFAPIYKLKEFIIIDLIANVLFTASSIILLNKFGNLYGIAYSYVILNLLLCIVYYTYLKIIMNFEFKSYAKKSIVISFSILTSSYIVIEILNMTFIYELIILFVILCIWFKLVIDDEKILKVKNYMKKKRK